MNLQLLRAFFVVLSILLSAVSVCQLEEPSALTLILAVTAGASFAGLLVAAESTFRASGLRGFNTTMLGVLFGYMMATVLLGIVEIAIPDTAGLPYTVTKGAVLLFSLYIGLFLTATAAENFAIAIPFVRLTSSGQKRKDYIVDNSALSDVRLIDLASTGLLDNSLVVPRFVASELYEAIESTDESARSKARRAVDVLKKLEELPGLNLRYIDADANVSKDPQNRMSRLARMTDSSLLISASSKVQQPAFEGVTIVNMHGLSAALKPVMQGGETIEIKIQRYGKEPRQGVGYLEDGTMVVVNGGGDFIGETISVYVLSVKHTSSGRMIFCNAKDEKEFATAGAGPSKEFLYT